jgi:hypothetical protein
MDPPESASKIAEAIAGWAKNPGFRTTITEKSGIYVPHFKRRLTARKQNRINVFWTLKLPASHWADTEVVTTALVDTIKEQVAELNTQTNFPFAISTPSISQEIQIIPTSWKFLAALLLGLLFGFLLVYLKDAWSGKVTWLRHLRQRFPDTPLLHFPGKISRHDKALLESFILTFQSPRLVGTFAQADDFFNVHQPPEIDLENDTPILLVRLGHTNLNDLDNLQAIFGEDLGLVVFES